MSNSTFDVYLQPNPSYLVTDWKEPANPCAASPSLPALDHALAVTLIPFQILSLSQPETSASLKKVDSGIYSGICISSMISSYFFSFMHYKLFW